MTSKLHVGCGERFLPGYVHVDSRMVGNVSVVCDLTVIDAHFARDSVDEIYNCAVLEHLRPEALPVVLSAFRRILKPGGLLVSSVPNFHSVVRVYQSQSIPIDGLFGMLYGKADYPWNEHHCTFDAEYFGGLLGNAGFENIRDYDWRGFLPPGYDDFSRAYMPHMDFENGIQMMINVMAERPAE